MANTKASDIFTLKKKIREQGVEQNLLSRLTPEAAKIYLNSAANSWVPIAGEAEILNAAASLLYPREASPLRHLGHEIARINFSGIYKVFLLVATVPFLIKRVPQIWGTLFDQGEAKVENLAGNSGTLVVRGMSELQAAQREYISGFIIGLLELAGARQVQVAKIESNPQAWAWKIKWLPASAPGTTES